MSSKKPKEFMMQFFFKKNWILTCILTTAAVTLLSLFGNKLTDLFLLPVLLLLPGYLLYRIILPSQRGSLQTISFSLGLSLLILMLIGLAANSLSLLGHQNSLNHHILLTFICIVFVILFSISKPTIDLNYIRSIVTSNNFSKDAVWYISLSIVPILSIFGATRIDNGASNILTLIMFALIAILMLSLIIFKRTTIYPFSIVMFGLGILFSVSMRGYLITGHDIQKEIYVFHLTSSAQHWAISNYKDSYNACLSITILPTVLYKLTHFSEAYIYKFVFQAVYAISLLGVYELLRKLSTRHVAYLGTFLFISFPTFINDMTMLNRQEIAFIFFTLILIAGLNSRLSARNNFLCVILMFGLILSHYSTSYIAFGLFILTAYCYKLFSLFSKNQQKSFPLLNVNILLVGLLITFLWNVQITNSAGGLTYTVKNTISSLISNKSDQSGDVSYSLLNKQRNDPQNLLDTFTKKDAAPVVYVGQYELPVTKLGRSISHIININRFNNFFRSTIAKLLQLLLIIGLFSLANQYRRSRQKFDAVGQYTFCAMLVFTVLLVLQTILPSLSVNYGTLRFFQQALVLLAIPIVIGMQKVLGVFRLPTTSGCALLFVLFFLHLSGLIPQITGGYAPQLSLNNIGVTYDAFYVHQSEIDARGWTQTNLRSEDPIAIDDYAQFRFLPLIVSHKIQLEQPFTLRKDTYLFQDTANSHANIYQARIEGNIVNYAIVSSSKRNQIYTNGSSNVFGHIQ